MSLKLRIRSGFRRLFLEALFEVNCITNKFILRRPMLLMTLSLLFIVCYGNTYPLENVDIGTPMPAATNFLTYSSPGTYSFTIPAGVTTITVDAFGGGGRGGSRTSGNGAYGGGGGGAFSRHTISVTPGQSYTVSVGSGSNSTSPGGDSWVSLNNIGNAFVLAKGGNSVPNNSVNGASGGSASSGIGAIRFNGGTGANGSSPNSGGGGSSASSYGAGNNGSNTNGGVAPLNGGNGGNGRNTNGNGFEGSYPSGGGGGAIRTSGSPSGGNGGNGKVVISYAPVEICDNGVDDDGDGLIDNNDLDCVSLCATGGLLLERWLGINGTEISQLTSNSNYPNNPSQSLQITSFQSGTNIGDNYGTRVRGYLTPTISGFYLFNLNSDDQGALYLSNDPNAFNKEMIASVSGWTNFGEYNKFPSQTSSEIYLIAGQNYYIELLHKEGTGGDHFQVSWQTPETTTWSTIPGSHLRSLGCTEICGNGIDDDGDGLIDCNDPDCNLINNSEFNDGLSNWVIYTQPGTSATLNLDNTSKLSGVNSSRLNINSTSGTDWHAQLAQIGKSLVEGERYEISFDAMASTNRNISMSIQLGQSPWTNFHYQNFGLTTTKQSFSTQFTSGVNITNLASILFNVAGNTGTVWIDNIKFRVICDGVTECDIPVFNFRNPTLISGIAGNVGAIYKFNNVLPQTDAHVTVVSKTHSDIVLLSLDEPAATNGGYDDAFQPIIDYNWYNGGGPMDPAGEKSMTFRFNFYESNTTTPKNISQISMTALDVDGDGFTIREFVETNGFDGYQLQTPTTLNISGSLKAKGSLPAFPGVDENDLTGMISFIYNNENTVSVTYGADYSGLTYNSSVGEERLNSLYFKCYQFNTFVECPTAEVTGSGLICPGQTVTLTANRYGSVGNCQLQWQVSTNGSSWSNIAGANGINYTTSALFNDTYYRVVYNCDGRPECGENTSNVKIIITEPKTTLNGPSTICIGSTTSLSPTAGGSWVSSNPALAMINSSGVVTGISAGNVTFTFTESSTGCTSVPSSTVTILNGPNPSISGANAICAGSSSTFTASEGTSYLWSTLATTASITVNTAGTYTVTVTNASGCTSTATRTLAVNGNPSSSISGVNTICAGNSTTFTASGGTSYLWSTSATTSSITINTAGTYTVTVTNASGCTSTATRTLSVNANPSASISGVNTICAGSSTTFIAIGGTSYVWNTSETTSTITVNTAGTYTVTVTNASGCTSTATRTLSINANPSANISGTNSICAGGNTIFTASGGTSYLWNTSATTSSITVNTAGTYTVTVTNESGCTSTATRTLVVNANPIANINGANSICAGGNTIFTASGGTSYLWSNNSAQASILISEAGNYTVTVTSADGCTSIASKVLSINPALNATLDYFGNVCLTDTSKISATLNGGAAPYTYYWTGPLNYQGNTQIIDIENNGNYYVTVTDVNGCFATANGYIFQRYEPFIGSLGTEICEGEIIDLQVNSPSAVSFQWGSNAGNATTANVTVAPTFPSSFYYVTVTNDLGCKTVPSVNINVKQKPIINITGPNEICVGDITNLWPNTGGTWESNYPSIANISNEGVITGLSGGTANFVFINSTTQCSSDPSEDVIVYEKPQVSITGPTNICQNQSTILLPSIGGIWMSNNPSIASVTPDGIVTGLSYGSATFVFTDDSTGCNSLNTSEVTITDAVGVFISGPQQVCVDNSITLSVANNGGSWFSSNPSIASVNPTSGVVIGLSEGFTEISYILTSGPCIETATYEITVNEKPLVSVTGDTAFCAGHTTQLLPSNGGEWVSNQPEIAIVNHLGIVTGVSEGNATFTFINSYTGCHSEPTAEITIFEKPEIILSGDNEICVGNSTSFTQLINGTWSSSNMNIASISQTGVVTGVNSGSVTFTYTHDFTGCVSEESVLINVTSKPTLAIDYNGSICLTDTSKLYVLVTNGTPAFSYNWSGPSGFSGSAALVSIANNGNYNVTVTDSKGCSADISAFVYQRYEPTLINLSSTVCEGEQVNLSVNASNAVSYHWSQNANNATSQTVNVSPIFPSSAYFVTVTSDIGCKTVLNANVSVHSKPLVEISGATQICIGSNTNLLPALGGSWTSLNPSVASIDNFGLITGLTPGEAKFKFYNTVTGCYSDTSTSVFVLENITTSNGGASTLCTNQNTQLIPSSGGIWQSSNPTIASVSPSGLVTGLSQGVSYFSFTSEYGCTSFESIHILVNERPGTLMNGDNEICQSTNTTFLPSSGGTWSSLDPNIATINNQGLVSGINPGQTSFVFVDSSTGCPSLPTVDVTVKPLPTIMVNGATEICVGQTTQLLPSVGGVWFSSNNVVANINSSGIVNGLNDGNAIFSFMDSTTGCLSNQSSPISVIGRPILTLNGPSSLCVGGTTQVSSSSVGTWHSSNTSVATITQNGQISTLANGTTIISFTDSQTGCSSQNTFTISVYSKPTVAIVGPTQLCIGMTTSLLPNNQGIWVSSNTNVVSVNNLGIVTALSPGSAQFTFIEANTGCTSDLSETITVSSKPEVSVIGISNICVGETTSLSPSTGGTWQSLQPLIASVTGQGLVTGLSNGSVSFRFTTQNGCISDPTTPIIINGKPSVSISGHVSICKGSTTQLSPSTGGTWISSNPNVAIVNNQGLVTAIEEGVAKFLFTQTSTGCTSDSTNFVSVNPLPNVNLTGPSTICIGTTTTVSPTVGGAWSSSNSSVANVNNLGIVTGFAAGSATLFFTELSTGCTSDQTINLTVNPKPTVVISGPNSICVGSTTALSPSNGGVWSSLNPSVATVNSSSGVVTGVIMGSAKFTFTNSITGCSNTTLQSVIVYGKPTITFNGPQNICFGQSTSLLPSSGGTWTSSDPNIAIINNQGIVTTINSGNVRFNYTDETTGCTSSQSEVLIIQSPISVSVQGPTSICLGYTTQLSPSSGGIWMSTNPNIATVSNTGIVTALAPGKVSFYFIENVSGCTGYLPDEIVNISNCLDPDFNVTSVNKVVTGNVSTNDDLLSSATYSKLFIKSKPVGSIENLTMNIDGSYTFTANMKGKYIYHIQVCIPPAFSGCPTSKLEINVVDLNDINSPIVANLDFATVYQLDASNGPSNILLNTLTNDACINRLGCDIYSAIVTIEKLPINGQASVLSQSKINYSPNAGFVGRDTIIYKICSSVNQNQCVLSTQIITVNSATALNSTVAVDDFFTTQKGGFINGNVMLNDSDPEMDEISVIPQGSKQNPIITSNGTYYLESNGSFVYTPNQTFTGTAEFIYNLCDDNLFCTNATVHILVIEPLSLKLRVYLEGALIENGNQKSTDGRPLMRDDLRVSPIDGLNYLPSLDPYSYALDFVDLRHRYTHIGSGNDEERRVILNSDSIFSITGQNAIVDWIFVEIRSKTDYRVKLATRSGLLQRDGDIVDLDGISPLSFPGVSVDSAYVVVRHRNHLGIMSQIVSVNDMIDFTKTSTLVFDFGNSLNNGYNYTGLAQKNNPFLGVNMMWGGDFDGDGRIKFVNPNDDQNILFYDVLYHPSNVLSSSNFNFAHGYYQGDFNMNGKAKFDNPNDDKNYLFLQILFHPLNTNFISNFNFVIQQVP